MFSWLILLTFKALNTGASYMNKEFRNMLLPLMTVVQPKSRWNTYEHALLIAYHLPSFNKTMWPQRVLPYFLFTTDFGESAAMKRS